MIAFFLRCVFTLGLLSCVRYSTDFTHVDVRDPHPCLALLGNAQVQPGDACIYYDANLHGSPLARQFWIEGTSGVQVESREASVEFATGNQSGWTWGTSALILVACLPWIVSLLSLLYSLGRPSELDTTKARPSS